MELTVVSSCSQGNSYVLTASDGQQLCLEAGRPLPEVKRVAKLKTAKCVGVLISHLHTDHCKYAKDFIKAGIDVYSCHSVATSVLGVNPLEIGETYSIGSFRVIPFAVEHDCEDYGYVIFHPEYGSIFFATDCYNLKQAIRGCKTYMCECNYEDALLEKATQEAKTTIAQAERVRLSHMSLNHAVAFMQECEAEKTARQIILIHGSARHLIPEVAVSKFQRVIGVPTYYAEPGLKLELL